MKDGDDRGCKSHDSFRDVFACLFDESVVKNLSGTLVVLTRVLTPLGPLIAGATEEGLCLLEFAEHPQLKTRINRLCKEIHCVVTPGENAHINRVQHELDEYFSGKRIDFDVPLSFPVRTFSFRFGRNSSVFPTVKLAATRTSHVPSTILRPFVRLVSLMATTEYRS